MRLADWALVGANIESVFRLSHEPQQGWSFAIAAQPFGEK